MRLFQNSGLYQAYRPRLLKLAGGRPSFAQKHEAFFADRYGAAHFLSPVLAREPSAFFANGDDEDSQRAWASEQGLKSGLSLDDILLTQIEAHRTEVFYNMDPVRYGDAFVDRLPGCVRRTIAWRAAPSGSAQFLRHDLIINNFPSILDNYRRAGARTAYFSPAHDPEMDSYAAVEDRPIDVLFVGGYSRHHMQRGRILEVLAGLRTRHRVVLHLDVSRATRWSETWLGSLSPLRRYRRPRAIRAVDRPAVFGRDLLAALGQAKIVLNGAIDMSGEERGNLRIWEAMGCGAALLSDTGRYPRRFEAGRHFAAYAGADEMVEQIDRLLCDDTARRDMARRGHELVSTAYSKKQQWAAFQELAA